MERVDALRKDIEQATGEPCWIDRDGIESDAQFVSVIMSAIKNCEIFLFMRSKEHNNITNHSTDWTIREVNYALAKRKRIVFISLDNAPLSDWFEFMFPNQQEIDALDTTKLERFYTDLRSWLKVEETKEKSAPMTRITMAPVKYYIGTLKGHTSHVNFASFSPDGSRIVSASMDKTVRIWDAATGECIRTLEGHTKYVLYASFSHDGSRIVSASSDKTIRIWDAATGDCIRTLEGHTSHVYSASFSPDGRRIVSASGDETVRIWDAATGECIRTLRGHTGNVCGNSVYSASFSPDGSRIVSASMDETVRIWDAATGECIRTLEGHTSSVYSASFSPNSSRIVSASWDKTVRIWDISYL